MDEVRQSTPLLKAARAGDQRAFGALIEPYRRELQLHCYRMLGSLQDAEDLTQETFLRAWRRLDQFEGRAPLRAWLYKIATHACLDALDQRPGRALVPDHAANDPRQALPMPRFEPVWLEPYPDEALPALTVNPEARYAAHESVSLAFLAALQLLTPRQRAILVLRDVLDWQTREVAELLDMHSEAVNSALHRARATLAKQSPRFQTTTPVWPVDAQLHTLVNRYVQAWEAGDVGALVSLLREDALATMPPFPVWFTGREAIQTFLAGQVFAQAGPGAWRVKQTRANGQPALALYQYNPTSGVYEPFALQVLDCDSGAITALYNFVFPNLFSRFGV